jgi:hypothetical protein
MNRLKFVLCSLFVSIAWAASASEQPNTADGYRGIWYSVGATKNEYKFKYSGGFATYPQQQEPIAIYRKEVNKTFFCYGGTTARDGKGKQDLLHMVSYFDHNTGEVPRPTILLDKHTGDAHDNPTMAIDDAGYIWIFSSSHGTSRPSFINRSAKPYSIEKFEQITQTNFSYTEPWYEPGRGFLFLHTRYKAGRNLFWMTSPDGRTWSDPHKFAYIDMGDYQIGWCDGSRVATAFDYHPTPLGLDGRANIYFAQTRDFGQSWETAGGEPLTPPFTNIDNPARIYNSRAEGKLVYLKDLNFDAAGHPVILFLTSKGHEPGPANGPRQWKTAHWLGDKWSFQDFTTSQNNYDHGSLYIEPDGTWRVIAPTTPGPQAYNPGGEMVMWASHDEGKSWEQIKQLTHGSSRNHNYARRPVNANPEFYALWADGNPRQMSESYLYFTNQKGDHVWRLPAVMKGESAKPEIIW